MSLSGTESVAAEAAGAAAGSAVGAAAGFVAAEALCFGSGEGEILILDEALSFWGGTNLETGVITDIHHPQHGVSLGGRVLVMSASRGSSSSSSVLAEQIRAGVAPVAILLGVRDAIIVLGALAAAEMYDNRMPILLLDDAALAALPRTGSVRVVATETAASVSWTGYESVAT
jgi:predicted aconitase with swiveling domain